MSFEGGYFSYLRKYISDNELDNLVKVSANTVWHSNNLSCGGETLYRTYPNSLIKSDATKFYHSNWGVPAKIIFDMKGQFSITGLALRGNTQCSHLRAYSFQGSNDKINWKNIIENNNDDLQYNYNWHSYSFDKVTYRYFRIFQSENASLSMDGVFYFGLSGVDFTGSMVKYARNTCFSKSTRNYYVLLIIITHIS